MPAEDEGMLSRHLGVLNNLHITVARHGLTTDFAPPQEIAPFANREELPLGAPGVGDQHPHNPAHVALAPLTTCPGCRLGRHGLRFAPPALGRHLPHYRPLASGGGNYLWSALLLGSLFRFAIGAYFPVRIQGVGRIFKAWSCGSRRWLMTSQNGNAKFEHHLLEYLLQFVPKGKG